MPVSGFFCNLFFPGISSLKRDIGKFLIFLTQQKNKEKKEEKKSYIFLTQGKKKMFLTDIVVYI